jgi:glycosyltransferase involved in cell wall biosynthesis
MTRGDLTIANSLFTRDHVLAEHRLDPARLAVAPEGIDIGRFDPARVGPERIAAVREAWGLAADDRRPILLLAARLTGWKGQGVMIEAMARLAGAAGPWLILAGRPRGPQDAQALQAAASRAGVAGRVRLAGPVDDMPAALAAADVVVAPSTLPESFGRTVVEAAAMARPVIASPLGGPAETIVQGVTGWLAPAGDARAWAAAVDLALATPPGERVRMGAAARERAVRLYSLEAMTAATFAVYRRALAMRDGAARR